MSAVRFAEPARSYWTTVGLFTLLVGGFLIDLLVVGGGGAHVVAWIAATVVVVGLDALVVHAARAARSITVTDDEVRVGEDVLVRNEIVAVETAPDDSLPVLGRRFGEGVPRNMAGVGVHLADGARRVIATRRPQRLVAALDVGVAQPAVRPAEPDDIALIPQIDERAESLFRVSGIDLPQIPLSADDMRDAKAVWVAGRPPVGFLQLDEVDGLAHVQAFAVLPSHMRKGLGTTLLDEACAWAQEKGYHAITLCTYADIAWNGPFYVARGFVEIETLTPELAELRDWEHDVGLDELGRRCVMRRELA